MVNCLQSHAVMTKAWTLTLSPVVECVFVLSLPSLRLPIQVAADYDIGWDRSHLRWNASSLVMSQILDLSLARRAAISWDLINIHVVMISSWVMIPVTPGLKVNGRYW